ncbi:MAG: thioredoxin domain-containing protein [Mariprofundus sp.]|nr:thioredoxin domain-containing protein [Mariprofundus sp.]
MFGIRSVVLAMGREKLFHLPFEKMFKCIGSCLLSIGLIAVANAQGVDVQAETDKKQHVYSNALIHESSPYLQQHAHNPVNWMAWGEDAFALARLQDKPIFLSIGYSTCHWCHVMEKESFEDAQVAAVLNRYFVAIKVDREERPDIDAVYMHAARMINGSGGWPLNLLLTPDKKPFFAATYMPKDGRFGRMGLIELAERVGAMWQQDRQRIETSANSIAASLRRSINVAAAGTDKLVDTTAAQAITADIIDQAYMSTAKAFDVSHGGFGAAPKFPSAQRLLFLLRYALLKDQPEALSMVEKTLTAMQRGGIHDQLGGGFHRYSTDADWLLPHFEKMLYDQAMLMMAYAEAFRATGNARFSHSARDIAEYVLRDMRDAGGAFYAAEDADSAGVEGKFYVWTAAEIKSVLGKSAAAFMRAYGVNEQGNFSDESSHKKTGENILHRNGAVDVAYFQADIKKLMAVRAKRVRPFRDDKVLTDWNGLTIAALAMTGRILNEPRYVQAATQAADFILGSLRDKHGGLLHRWRAGEAAIPAQLEDYTSMVWGLIELYEASFETRWLKSAVDLNASMLKQFKGADGGLYQVVQSDDLIARPMEIFDTALPSGNAVAMHNLLCLSRLTGKAELEAEVADLAGYFAHIAKRAPDGVLHMLSAVMMAANTGKEIVLAGDKDSDDAAKMLAVIAQHYHPNTVVLWHDAAVEALAPFTEGQIAMHGKVTAYVCENFQCNQPTTSLKELQQYLQ